MRSKLFVSLCLVILLIMLPILPFASIPVSAVTTISISVPVIESTAIQVAGTVIADGATLVYYGVKFRRTDSRVWSSEENNRAVSNPFKIIIKNLTPGIEYEVRGFCVYKRNNVLDHIESAPVYITTLKKPAFNVTFDQIQTTSARMLVGITLNGHKLSKIDYTVNKSSDNALIIKENLMTNVTTGGTKAKTITGLSSYTDYYVYLLVTTALGAYMTYGKYTFKTARFAVVTILPRLTPTPTVKPVATPTPTVKPTATPAPTPTTTPKPTPSPTPKPTATPAATPTAKPTPTTKPAATATPAATEPSASSYETEATDETSSDESTGQTSQTSEKPATTSDASQSETAEPTSTGASSSAETSQQSTAGTGNQAQGGTGQGLLSNLLSGDSPVMIVILVIIALALIAIIVLLILNMSKKRKG